eukprot:TRINITY_DN5013_c0_g1_i1.p2 TRINITY_DN5013_c0_g1~~TRINITY_DN5013_c0_g1_i1.p2  ORF type:complete len:192 (+),score=43.83 TRINITY_DN5013_c0_g1_i1:260-835(+)
MLRRTAGLQAGPRVIPRVFTPREEVQYIDGSRLSEIHMQGERGQTFREIREKMTRQLDQFPGGKPLGGTSSPLSSDMHNYHKPEDVHAHVLENNTEGDYVAYPYPAMYAMGFIFTLWILIIGSTNNSRETYMRPDPDCDDPRFRLRTLGPKKYGREPLASDANPVTGDLCIIRPFANRDDFIPFRGTSAPH